MTAHLQGRERALELFGWTGREAEWIALVCLHSGVFTRAQLSSFLGIDRWKAFRFVRDMSERRLASETIFEGRKVCRIAGRRIYRALGAEDIRHRRTASPEVLLRRLLSLDYVIERPDLPWLPTEPEKVGALEALDIERRLFPLRVYRGAAGSTRRYFPVKLPVALDTERAVFVYAEPGHDTSSAICSWRDAHRRLWEALRDRGRSVEIVAVGRTREELRRAGTILGKCVRRNVASDPSAVPASNGAARREIARIEQAILRRDRAVVEEYGNLQACLKRIVALKDIVQSSGPEALINGVTTWRSARLPGGGS